MYDYDERDGDSVKSAGIGSYCLMGSGNHNDNGRSPSPVCAYLRDLAGWCDNEIELNVAKKHKAKQGDYNTVMRFRTSKPSEYFLIENRSRMNMDRGLPASGLAVYHCDITGSNELQQGTAAKHYQCALVQADGRRDLELEVNRGDGADLFGAMQGVVLSGTSTPNTREWDGRDSGLVAGAVVASGEAQPMVAIPDNVSAGVSSTIAIAESGTVAQIKVKVDIKHPYIGDLRVALASPSGRTTVLHPRLGGSSDDLIATFDSGSPGMLGDMIGPPFKGNWVLKVSDRARRDVGTLRRWSLELRSTAAESVHVAEAQAATRQGSQQTPSERARRPQEA